MQHDPSVSLLAEGGGKIVAMSGGGTLRGGAPTAPAPAPGPGPGPAPAPAITITGVADDILPQLRSLLILQNAMAATSASASPPLATVSEADLTDPTKTDSIKTAFLMNVTEYIRQDTSKFNIKLTK